MDVTQIELFEIFKTFTKDESKAKEAIKLIETRIEENNKTKNFATKNDLLKLENRLTLKIGGIMAVLIGLMKLLSLL